MTGNALNAVMRQLNNPQINESSYRSAEVTLPVNIVRRIPFKLGEKNEKFSMSRLSLKGKAKLPPASRTRSSAGISGRMNASSMMPWSRRSRGR